MDPFKKQHIMSLVPSQHIIDKCKEVTECIKEVTEVKVSADDTLIVSFVSDKYETVEFTFGLPEGKLTAKQAKLFFDSAIEDSIHDYRLILIWEFN